LKIMIDFSAIMIKDEHIAFLDGSDKRTIETM